MILKEEFRRQAFIPEDVSLELENFDEFYEKKKRNINCEDKGIVRLNYHK